MNFLLSPSRTVISPWRPTHSRSQKILLATGKNEGSKPSENGTKSPKEALDKKAATLKEPIHKEVKAFVDEIKTPPPVTKLPTPSSLVEEKKAHFTNKQRFVVPTNLEVAFKRAWEDRERFMKTMKGFVGLKVVMGTTVTHRGKEVTVSSEWQSIPEWEAYSCSFESRKSQLPTGIYQFVPKRGEGFPEDFVPFLEYKEPVSARY